MLFCKPDCKSESVSTHILATEAIADVVYALWADSCRESVQGMDDRVVLDSGADSWHPSSRPKCNAIEHSLICPPLYLLLWVLPDI